MCLVAESSATLVIFDKRTSVASSCDTAVCLGGVASDDYIQSRAPWLSEEMKMWSSSACCRGSFRARRMLGPGYEGDVVLRLT